MKHILRALKHRNYRLFFFGQGTSLIGSWMQMTAMSWMVYRLTNSAFLLGTINFLSQIPMLFFTPFGGVLADRLNLRRFLIVTQILAMIQALLLSILVITDKITLWHLMILVVFLGVVTAFDTPSMQAFIVRLVDKKEDLGNAIALNSIMFNSARLIGPSIAGILIARTNEGVCFLINSISYIAALIALILMKINFSKKEVAPASMFTGLKEGFVYAFRSKLIRDIILLITISSLFGLPFAVLMPIFAKDILHGGAHTLGFLMASVGIGALIGALFLASLKNIKYLRRIIPFSTGTFGLSVVLFSLSRNFWLSSAIMIFTGISMIGQMVASNTMLQTIVDDDKRGRVMSLFTISFMGIAPFGSLLAGVLSSRIGAPNTLLLGGILCILASILFYNNFNAKEDTVN